MDEYLTVDNNYLPSHIQRIIKIKRNFFLILKKKLPDCFELFKVNRNRIGKEKAKKDSGAFHGQQRTHHEEVTGELGRSPGAWQHGCPFTPSSL